MTSPNVNPSPKARFVSSKANTDSHRELISRPDFNRSVETALAQMMWLHSSGGEPSASIPGNDAAGKFYRLQGAQEFLTILKTLAETSVPLTQPDTDLAIHSTFK